MSSVFPVSVFPTLKPLAIACCIALASSCSSQDSTDPFGVNNGQTISGTAAAGAPIIGQVTVKGSHGLTKSALIEANGNYNVDVSGLTAPYRLRAEGTVGGRTYKLHSYAEETDIGGNVNITPFTDLIIANAAGQIAEAYFNSTTPANLDPAEISAQETALQTKLQAVFDAIGVGSAIDLLRDTFSADHSGLDAALDVVRVQVDPTTNIATITNLIENSSISDNLTDTTDNTTTLAVTNPTTVGNAVTDTQAIVNLFNNMTNQFSGGLPSANAIQPFFSTGFLNDDMNLSQFLTDITTDPAMVGLTFRNIAVTNLTANTADVTFNVAYKGVLDHQPAYWTASKDPVAGWQLNGDQRIVEAYFGFHCNKNAYNGQAGGCGINTAATDNDFTNNGTNNAPIQSATVSIIDGTNGQTKAVIHLGTPATANGGTAGGLQVYNANAGYQDDYKGFGTGAGDIDPAIFAVGDTLRFDLYTEALDITNPSAPAIVANATPVSSFSQPLLYTPSTTGMYPVIDTAAQTAIANYAIGSNLTISWTPAAGTVNSEVLVSIYDAQFNSVETYANSFTASNNSITIASTDLDTSVLDQNATSYGILVRVYTIDVLTGQYHSIDYETTIAGPAAQSSGGTTTTGGGSAALTCATQSGWDDFANNGLGAPITPYSFADYETVIADCGGLIAATRADVAGSSFDDMGEVTTFNDTGLPATAASPETGTIDDGAGTIFQINWYIDNGYVVLFSNSSIDPNVPVGVEMRETRALVGVTLNGYNFVNYFEQNNFSDMIRNSGSDGEIWSTTATLLP